MNSGIVRWLWAAICAAGVASLVYVALYRVSHPLAWAVAGAVLLGAAWRTRSYRPRPRWLEIGLAVVSTAVTVLVALGAAEVLARLTVAPESFMGDSLVEPHPQRIWTPRPGATGTAYVPTGEGVRVPFTFSISDYGLRGTEPAARVADEYRVLLIGDSFTLGRGVNDEETIAVQLERELGKRLPDRTVTVLNGGCGGYGPWQEADLLDELGFPLQPDLVVLQLLMDNDIGDTLIKDRRVLESYQPTTTYFQLVYGRLTTDVRARLEDALYRTSVFYKLLIQRSAGRWRLTQLMDGWRLFDEPLVPNFPPPAARPAHLEPALVTWYPALEDGWGEMKADVAGIAAACASRHVPMLIYAVPNQAYVDDSAWTADPRYDRMKPERLVEAFVAESGMPYVDLFREFRRRDDGSALYYPVDGHFTAAGAAAAAHALSDRIGEDFASGSAP